MGEVALERVGKTYPNGIRAVHDLSLAISNGELVVLVGPSGCGKTTTLRLIAGLETPTDGLVRIAGRVVNGVPPHRRDVAMAFQRPALYPHLTVRQNLAFSLTLRRSWFSRRPAVEAERVRQVAELLDLAGVLERRPGELSGGQQQRVALGRALVRQPAVFLLDEPLSHLDARLRLEMRRELHLLHCRLRTTMVYVTHDQDEAMALGDRVAVLDRGEVQQVGPPRELYERPANRFVAGFLGWPPMNLLDGRLVEKEGGLRFVCGPFDWPAPNAWRETAGGEVTVGIRPEHVRLRGADPNDGMAVLEVRLVERLGPVSLVTLQRGGLALTARLEGALPVGEQVAAGVEIPLARAHLFDRTTGRVLSHGGAQT
jgi:multiple sugar transport system ATP-binding protein